MTEWLTPIPFGVQVSSPESRHVRIELAENMYVEQNPDAAKGPLTLMSAPGLELLGTAGEGPIRGMKRVGDKLYVVSGDELYSMVEDGTATLLTEISGNGLVSIISNRPPAGGLKQIAIGTNQLAYAGNETDGFTSLAETGLNKMTYQDGYGMAVQSGTQNFFISELDDLTTWNSLDVTTADTFPDSAVSVLSDHREPWVFKEDSIEVFTNSGNPSFPFDRVAFIEHGCIAPHSTAKAENNVFWLDHDGVYRAQGYQPVRISTPAVDYEISQNSSPQSAIGYTYSDRGHVFYVLSLSTTTLVYDLTTGLWHKRRSYGLDRWRAQNYERIWQKHIVGDYSDGKIYEMKRDVYTENGNPHLRRSVSSPLYNKGHRVLMDVMCIDCQHGHGPIDGSANNIMLDWTDDYGHTWSNTFSASMGLTGEYEAETAFFGLGSFFQRSYRLAFAGNAPFVLTGVNAQMEVCDG